MLIRCKTKIIVLFKFYNSGTEHRAGRETEVIGPALSPRAEFKHTETPPG